MFKGLSSLLFLYYTFFTLLLGLGAALKHNKEVDRFQVSGGGDNNAYVVDTVTGQVWSRRSLSTKHGAEFALPKAEEPKF
jgi:hypothetical protein